MKSKLFLLLATVTLVVTSGCANVKPWQREHLADELMNPDRMPLARGNADHIWFSREEATGGAGVGGGGCGCN
jgi:hypothetical protein